MTPDEIIEHAEKMRKTAPSMGTYKTMWNDAMVLIRELAERVKELQGKQNV